VAGQRSASTPIRRPAVVQPFARLRSSLEIARTLIGSEYAGSSTLPFYLCGKAQYCAESRRPRSAALELLTLHSEVNAVRAGPSISNSSEKSNAVSNSEALSGAGLVDALLEIGRERQRIMEAMKAALLRGDDDTALEHARELTGLPRHKSQVSGVTT
jgi:hypothetical protein